MGRRKNDNHPRLSSQGEEFPHSLPKSMEVGCNKRESHQAVKISIKNRDEKRLGQEQQFSA